MSYSCGVELKITGPDGLDQKNVPPDGLDLGNIPPELHSSSLASSSVLTVSGDSLRASSILTVPMDASRSRTLKIPRTNPNYLSADYIPKTLGIRPRTPNGYHGNALPNSNHSNGRERRLSATSFDSTYSCHSTLLSYPNSILDNQSRLSFLRNSQELLCNHGNIDSNHGSHSSISNHHYEPLLDPFSRRLSWEISKLDSSDYYNSSLTRDCDTYSNIITPVPRVPTSCSRPELYIEKVKHKEMFCFSAFWCFCSNWDVGRVLKHSLFLFISSKQFLVYPRLKYILTCLF